MKFVVNLNKISLKDVVSAGGKAASLGEMLQSDISVPKGFVVLAPAFNLFLKETEINVEIEAIFDEVNPEVMHTVENASAKIQALILEEEIPKPITEDILCEFKSLNLNYVAVRSSATAEDSASAAWAGQLDTFLNTTENDLLENIKKCWASLFTPRAIFYRFEHKLNKENISVAVVVQQMVESEKSGIAFSVHPVTEDPDQLIIEAGFGLGEAIVSGQITPDSYVVAKDGNGLTEVKKIGKGERSNDELGRAPAHPSSLPPRSGRGMSILDININQQKKKLVGKKGGGNEWIDLHEKGKNQVLNEKEIIELSKLIVEIENHYGFPIDVEWTKNKEDFYILQSRPITTLSKKNLEKFEKFNPAQYQTLFRLAVEKGCVSGLTSEFLMNGPLLLGDPIITFDGQRWVFRIKKSKLSLLSRTGGEFFTNQEKCFQYVNNYKKYLTFVNKEIIPKYKSSKNKIEEQEFQELIKILKRQWCYYGWTESVYSELIFELAQGKEGEISKETFESLNYLKLEGRKVLDKFMTKDGVIDKLLETFSKQFKIKHENLKYFYQNDLESFFNDKQLNLKLIKERKKAFVLVGQNNKILYLDNQVAKKTAKRFTEFDENQFKKELAGLTGQSVTTGKVRGKVVIAPMLDIKAALEIEKTMKKGDILVVQSTNPDLIALCRKAGAIVTDQGGMLSHAAIISREFNIPCIVGTVNATKVFKTGMKVEVDADNGIVKKI